MQAGHMSGANMFYLGVVKIPDTLNDFIVSNNLDLIALTEMWLKCNEFNQWNGLFSQEYAFYHLPHIFCTGDGGALICHNIWCSGLDLPFFILWTPRRRHQYWQSKQISCHILPTPSEQNQSNIYLHKFLVLMLCFHYFHGNAICKMIFYLCFLQCLNITYL